MLSSKSNAPAEPLKSASAVDVHALTELIRREVERLARPLIRSAAAAEANARKIADDVEEDVSRGAREVAVIVRKNPVRAGLTVLAAGVLLGIFISSKK